MTKKYSKFDDKARMSMSFSNSERFFFIFIVRNRVRKTGSFDIEVKNMTSQSALRKIKGRRRCEMKADELFGAQP